MVLDRRRTGEDDEPSWLGPAITAMAVAAVLSSVIGTARTFQVGDSGAKATWQDIQDGAESGG
jgi:hypothetical protein